MAGRISYYGGIVLNGLVLDLDAGKKDSYIGYGSSWIDISNNNNNGTLINGPTFSSNNGGVLIFDGVDDYCVNPLSLGFTGPLTVMTFAKSNTPVWSNYGGLGSARFNNGYIIHTNLGLSSVTYYILNSTGTYFTLNTVTPSNIQNYNFYAITTNGTNQHKSYLNDTLVGTSTTNITRTNSNISQNNFLASDSGVSGRFTALTIGSHLIYNRELTQQEILQNYNSLKGRYN